MGHFYKEIFENSTAATAVIDSNTTIKMVNQAFCNMSGFSKEELIGTSWVEKMPSNEIERLLAYNKRRLDGIRDIPDKYELEYTTKQGSKGHALINVAFLKEFNQFVVTFFDITRRVEAEKRIKEHQQKLVVAMKFAKMGDWEFDFSKNLFYFNDAFYSIFRTSAKEVGTLSMTPNEYAKRFAHPDDIEFVQREVEMALKANKRNYTRQLEHRIVYSNGEFGYMAVRFTSIDDEQSETRKIIGINMDITAQKQAKKNLEQQANDLRELIATKDKFFSIIAHDLRSPFNAILGLSEVLAEETDSIKNRMIKELAQNIHKSSKLTVELISNLIDWSRAESGRIAFEPKTIQLQPFVEELVRLFIPSIDEKNIKINIEIDHNLKVFADLDMLSTICRNLISNAIKYTKKDGQIIISAKLKEEQVIISCQDSGVGMTMEQKNQVFRIDKSLSTPGTNQEQGTGLGLILCREFVEKHGGKIWVETEKDKGSQFSFTLPLIINHN